MSVTALDTAEWTAAERQAAARDAYRASGHRLSGAELGRRFGRSGRWGRAQVEAVATEDAAAAGKAAATGGQPDAAGSPLAATDADWPPADVPVAVRWASAGAVVAVAFVAAVASYAHMSELTRHAGEGWLAWFLPISVDGLVVAGSTTMLVRRRYGQGGGWLAWLAVGLGIGASLAANVVAADPSLVEPDVVRRVIAGWPPVALAISAELALQLRSGRSEGRRT
jgi:hypothetical protein